MDGRVRETESEVDVNKWKTEFREREKIDHTIKRVWSDHTHFLWFTQTQIHTSAFYSCSLGQ